MGISSINPANGEIIKSYSYLAPQELERKLRLSQGTLQAWRKSSFLQRKTLLLAIAAKLIEKKIEYANLMQVEMGKSQAEGIAEIEKCANCATYFSENGESFLADEIILSGAPKAYVHFAPLGTVLAIMPWNFPFWQVLRCAIPSIMAGNTVVLKHASNVSACALAIEDLFLHIGAPAGLFQTLLLSGEDASKLIERQEIQGISFTGSTDIGRKIATKAGASLKKCVLELGGSDAYVVLRDADLTMASATCAKSRLLNAGQSCISAKRFIVEATVYEEFCTKLQLEMQKISLAPMARADLRVELHKQVSKSISEGAKLQCGGAIPKGPGFYYPATLLRDVTPSMTAFREETFGPVAAVVKASSPEEAISLANQTDFGLGAAVFSENKEYAETIARDSLEAGSCFVNALVRSDSQLPFGGTKLSGLGRELSSFGIREFTNIKTIYVS